MVAFKMKHFNHISIVESIFCIIGWEWISNVCLVIRHVVISIIFSKRLLRNRIKNVNSEILRST